MPPPPGQKKTVKIKAKKKGFFDRLPGSKIVSQGAKDLGNIAKNAPGGIYTQGKAFGKDIAKGEYRNVGGVPVPIGKNTRAVWKEAGKSTAVTLKHPLRNPGYTLITALGIAAPGAKGLQVGARASKAGSAGLMTAGQKGLRRKWNPGGDLPLGGKMKPLSVRSTVKESWKKTAPSKTPTRVLKIKPKDAAEAAQWRKALGIKEPAKQTYGSGKGKTTFQPKPKDLPEVSVEIPASKRITTRAVQKGTDRLRAKSHGMQKKKIERELAREADYKGRLTEGDPLGTLDTIRAIKKGELGTKGYQGQPVIAKSGPSKARSAVADTNATVRALRLYRLGYIPPNALGAIATNLIQQGPRQFAKMVKGERRTRGATGADLIPGKKSSDTARTIDRLSGETIGEAMMDVGSGGAGGIPAAAARGVGTTLGKVTDRRSRARSWHHEATEQGYKVDDIPGLLERAKKGDKKALRDVVQISRRAEDSAIKFSRSKALPGVNEGSLAKFDRLAAENVFLYKWITGSTKYAGHVVKEHPTLTAALAQLGQQAPNLNDVLPEHPEFMDRYMPVGNRGGMPTVINAQAASLWDMPGEMAHLLAESLKDPLEATEQLNPLQHALVVAATGHDRFRDQHLPEDKQGPWDRINFAKDAELRSSPYVKLGPESIGGRMGTYDQSERLFPMSNWDILLQHALGGPFRSIRVNPKTAKKMKIQEDKKKKKRS